MFGKETTNPDPIRGIVMIACDVVLLPPLEIMEKAIAINRKIVESGNSEIVLDKERCLPHITLAMGCLKEEEMREVDNVLKDTAKSFTPIKLRIIPSKGVKAWFRIEKNGEIEELHGSVMKNMGPFFSYDVTKDMLYKEKDEEIHDVTIHYIKNFSREHSLENYEPHITVGHGDMDIEVPSFEFEAGELALCHLGSFCTCRKVLFSYCLSAD